MSGAWSTTQTWSCLVGGGQPRVSSPQVKNCPFLLFFPFAQLSICSSDQLSLELHGTSIASGFQWCAWRTKQPTTKSHQEEREWVFKWIQFLKKKISAEPAGAFFRCWEIGGKARSVSHIKPGLAPPALRLRLQQVMRVLTEKTLMPVIIETRGGDRGRALASRGKKWSGVANNMQVVFFADGIATLNV